MKLKNLRTYEDLAPQSGSTAFIKLNTSSTLSRVMNWLFDAGLLDDNGKPDPEYNLAEVNDSIKDEFGIVDDFFSQEDFDAMPKMILDAIK
jgi:hypothetical protein